MYKQQRLNSYNTQYNILVEVLKAYQQVHTYVHVAQKGRQPVHNALPPGSFELLPPAG